MSMIVLVMFALLLVFVLPGYADDGGGEAIVDPSRSRIALQCGLY